MKTKIILVRHAECVGNISNRLSGRTNFALTGNGIIQAKKLAQKLNIKEIDIIYSSPLQRAIDTAKIISKNNGNIEIKIDERLIEIDYGVCDGMSWDDINIQYPNIRKLWKEIYNYPIEMPKQESFSKVAERMEEVIKNIASVNEGNTVCIVSHGIAIQSYMCVLHKKAFKKANELPQLKNAEYIEFEI